MLTSCYVESPITLEKHFIEVDYNAQEIILNADEEILNINFDEITFKDAFFILQNLQNDLKNLI